MNRIMKILTVLAGLLFLMSAKSAIDYEAVNYITPSEVNFDHPKLVKVFSRSGERSLLIQEQKYSDVDLLEYVHYYDFDSGNLKTKVEYGFDKSNMTSFKVLDSNDNLLERHTVKYDENRIKTKIIESLNPDGSNNIVRKKNIYNLNNDLVYSLIRFITGDAGETYSQIYYVEKSDNEKLELTKIISKENSKIIDTALTRLLYRDGKKVKYSFFHDSKASYESIEYKYDDSNNLIQEASFRDLYGGAIKMSTLKEYHYDDYNNQISYLRYDDEKISESFIYKYRFDDRKNWIHKETYSLNENDESRLVSIIDREIVYFE